MAELTVRLPDGSPLALDAGATEINPVADHVHGDRAGSLRDPFGHRWATATHVEDVSPAEIEQRLAASA